MLVFDVLFLKQVLYIFSTQMWPEVKVSRVQGEVEYQEALFEVYLQCHCDCLQLVFDVLFLQQVLFSYLLRCGLKQSFQSLGRNITPTSIIWNFTPVQHKFYSFLSLYIACEVSAVLIVVSTQKWSETKNPGS